MHLMLSSMDRQVFVSVIIPVFNNLNLTRACVDSLLRDLDRPSYELIIIDNGSTDGTKDYLNELMKRTDHTQDNLIPIFNETNLGVAPAWNQGLKVATGEHIAILNNDIMVSKSWMRSLLWAMEYHKLDLISPFAQTGPLHYDLESRALKFTEKNLGKVWYEYDFCTFLMPLKTFQCVGLFDENYKIGGYEDTDYAYRMNEAGLKYGVTGASYIHHFGSSTLESFKKQGDLHVPHNLNYFINKWGKNPSHDANGFLNKLKRRWKRVKLKWDVM